MGGGDWADTFYTRREHDRREIAFNQRQSQSTTKPLIEASPASAAQPAPSDHRPTRFDRILNNDEVPSVSMKVSTPLLGSTRFDRILRDNED